MKLFKMHRSPDDAPGGTETPETAEAPATEAKNEDFPTESPLPSPEKALAEAKGIDEIDIDDDYSLDKLNEGGLEAVIKDGEKKAEKKEVGKAPKVEKKESNEFELDIEDVTPKGESTQEEKDSNWNMVAEGVDLGSLEEDTFEAFKAAVVTKLEAQKIAGMQEGRKLELEKFPDEARKLFDFLSVEGNTVEGFIKPLAIYDQYLALDDKAIVEADFKAYGHNDEDVKRLVDDLELDGKLDLKAKEVRLGLSNLRQQRENDLVAEARTTLKQKAESINNKRLEEQKQFKENLDNVKDFFGAVVTDRAKNAILKKFEDGVYRAKLAADPDAAVKVAMFLEFEPKLLSLIGRDLVDTGRSQVLKKLHNVGLPSGGKSNIAADASTDTFDAWKEKLAEEKSAQG